MLIGRINNGQEVVLLSFFEFELRLRVNRNCPLLVYLIDSGADVRHWQ